MKAFSKCDVIVARKSPSSKSCLALLVNRQQHDMNDSREMERPHALQRCRAGLVCRGSASHSPTTVNVTADRLPRSTNGASLVSGSETFHAQLHYFLILPLANPRSHFT
jgi:hypothetical protein